MKPNRNRWCVVPYCSNTSIKTPEKLFIHVPRKASVRRKWLELARRDPKSLSTKSSIFFCEDHFDLPNDMDNYMEYRLMGSVCTVQTKPGTLPKRFYCQPESGSEEQRFLEKKPRIRAQAWSEVKKLKTEELVGRGIASNLSLPPVETSSAVRVSPEKNAAPSQNPPFQSVKKVDNTPQKFKKPIRAGRARKRIPRSCGEYRGDISNQFLQVILPSLKNAHIY